MAEKIRLDRFLSEAGTGTRSEVKILIKKKLVAVNGEMVTDGGTKVDCESDAVTLNGKPVKYQKFLYYMLNKPQGVVSATKDGLSETVLELLAGEPTRDLFPVGRLDKDTEGLLLITNDGALAHALLSPKRHVDKTYFAACDKALDANALAVFRRGLDIGDEKKTLPAEIEPANVQEGEAAAKPATDVAGEPAAEASYLVTIREGRYHQIKRMFEALGSKVIFLKRLSMGPLKLDESLAPGEYRALTEAEIEVLI